MFFYRKKSKKIRGKIIEEKVKETKIRFVFTNKTNFRIIYFVRIRRVLQEIVECQFVFLLIGKKFVVEKQRKKENGIQLKIYTYSN